MESSDLKYDPLAIAVDPAPCCGVWPSPSDDCTLIPGALIYSRPSGPPYFRAKSSSMKSDKRATVNPPLLHWSKLRRSKLLTSRFNSNSATRSVINMKPGKGQTIKKSSPVHWLQSISYSGSRGLLYFFQWHARQLFTNRMPDSGRATPAQPVTISSRYSRETMPSRKRTVTSLSLYPFRSRRLNSDANRSWTKQPDTQAQIIHSSLLSCLTCSARSLTLRLPSRCSAPVGHRRTWRSSPGISSISSARRRSDSGSL
jgi:hypothetical protein